jgi:uncharacterized membrane-anchored protein YhcB (DUF1043 family)
VALSALGWLVAEVLLHHVFNSLHLLQLSAMAEQVWQYPCSIFFCSLDVQGIEAQQNEFRLTIAEVSVQHAIIAEMKKLHEEGKKQHQELKKQLNDMNTNFDSLRTDFDSLRTDLTAQIGSVAV